MKKIWLALLVLVGLGFVGVKTAASKSPPASGLDNKPPLEKKVFIHYKKGYARPPWAGGGKGEPKCYGFLSKGAKLKSVEDLTINPDLDIAAILNSALEWDSNTLVTLFGSHTTDPTADWDNVVPDGRNEFSFGDYPEDGVIAVTVVWGYFSGPPPLREIIEFDVLFDSGYSWGNAEGNPDVMDLQNIATHEIGHGVGMSDVYESTCNEVTMYGYSGYGEIDKRTLELADITGLHQLYSQ